MSGSLSSHLYGSMHPTTGAFPHGIPEEMRGPLLSDVKALSEATAVNLVVQIGGSTPRVMAVTNTGRVVLLCAVGSDALAGEIAHIRHTPSLSLREVFFSNPLRDREGTVVDHSRNPRYLVEMLARDSVEALEALLFDWNKLRGICFAAAGGLTQSGGINPNNQTFLFYRIHSQEYFRSLLAAFANVPKGSTSPDIEGLPLYYLNDADAGAQGEAQRMGLLEGEVLLNCQWGTGFGGSARVKVNGELERIPTVEEFGYSVVYYWGSPCFLPLWSDQKERGFVTQDNEVRGVPYDGINFESRIAGYGLCQRICEWFYDKDLEDSFSKFVSSRFVSSGEQQVTAETIKAYSRLRNTPCLTWKDSIHKDVMDAIIKGYCALRSPEGVPHELSERALFLKEALEQDVVEGLLVVVDHARKSAGRSDATVKIAIGGPLTDSVNMATVAQAIQSERSGVTVHLSELSSHEREALAFVP